MMVEFSRDSVIEIRIFDAKMGEWRAAEGDYTVTTTMEGAKLLFGEGPYECLAPWEYLVDGRIILRGPSPWR